MSNVAVLRCVDGLDEAAVEAVRQWRYEPTIINGRPVSVVLTDTVRFQLNNCRQLPAVATGRGTAKGAGTRPEQEPGPSRGGLPLGERRTRRQRRTVPG